MHHSSLPGGSLHLNIPRLGSSGRSFAWLVGEKLLRFSLAILVGAWTARYLGKESFGAIVYAQTWTLIVSAITPLGMDALALREIIRNPRESGRWIGTVLGFRLMATFVGCAVVYAIAVTLRPDSNAVHLLVVLLSVGAVFQCLETTEIALHARSQIQELVLPRMAVALLMAAAKVGLIQSGMSVYWFAGAMAIEQVLSGLLTLFRSRRHVECDAGYIFEGATCRWLVRRSWPLALSVATWLLMAKMAALTLGTTSGDAALGLYAAGVRLPESMYFIPAVLATSMLPGLVRAQQNLPQSYRAEVLRFLRISALLSWAVSIPLAVGAWGWIWLLFGHEYLGAVPVLLIHAVSLPFIFLGSARTHLLLNEHKTGVSLTCNLTGLALVSLLNAAMIPAWGVIGAALSTLLGFVVSGFLLTLAFPATRWIGWLQVHAAMTPWHAWGGRDGLFAMIGSVRRRE